jgi:ribonuclease HII
MLIAGVDEAGRGPLAGPVVAAAVVLPNDYFHPDVTDSKKLSAKKRELLEEEIKTVALSWSVIAVGHKRIDRLNIREATKLAMSLAMYRVKADFGLIDGNMIAPAPYPVEAIVKGDQKHIQISAASILAKVYRDRLMKTLDRKYSGYDLAIHAGYPTAKHRELVSKLGPSPVHRLTFRGVKEFVYEPKISIEETRNSW